MKSKRENILIVDDDPNNIRILGTVLREKNYNIAVATNGNQALNMALKRKPDLILLDIMMPEIDGYQVCRRLKEDNEVKDIPIIFLTAKFQTEDIVKGFQLGAADYVVKPFNFPELLARIDTHLELKRSKDIILEQSQELKALLHILCHDLSNPFFSMIGMMDVSSTITDIDELKEMIEYVHKAAQNGIKVIELVREMRVLEDKQFEMQLEPVSLLDAVLESLIILSQKFRDKNIEPEILFNEEIVVKAEKISLVNSVINNLITNAIKFSPSGSKVIISSEKRNGMAYLTIKDHGIGMPETLLNSLFDVSKNVTRYGTDGEIGTGFGMPLVKKFISAYNGFIEVASKENSGTQIKLIFKLVEP